MANANCASDTCMRCCTLGYDVADGMASPDRDEDNEAAGEQRGQAEFHPVHLPSGEAADKRENDEAEHVVDHGRAAG